MNSPERNTELRQLEETRLREQRRIDRLQTVDHRRRQGQFPTPSRLAEDMLKLAKKYTAGRTDKIRFLDPALGSGAFFSALLRVFNENEVASALGFEIDDQLAAVSKRLWSSFGLIVAIRDFAQEMPPAQNQEKANLIICNPPYVRHHYIGRTTKRYLKQLVQARTGITLSGLSGLHCYFLMLSDSWLCDGGRAIWLVPSEFMDVNYGQRVKQYLRSEVTLHRIHRFDPTNIQFADALVSSSVVVFEKRKPIDDVRVTLSTGEDLLNPSFSRTLALSDLSPTYKWSTLVGRPEPGVTAKSTSEKQYQLGDLFEIRRGIATGANSFFVVPKERAEAIGIPSEFLVPILPPPRHLRGDLVEADQDGNPVTQKSLVLIDCPLSIDEITEKFPALYRYLESGERRGLCKRYLLRHRQPWYKQESRPPAPILCTYMGRKRSDRPSPFRFIRNLSKATATNVYLLLYPKPVLQAASSEHRDIIDRIFARLTSLPPSRLLAEGRTYGGGLHKIEPGELSRVRVNLGTLPGAKD